MKKFSLYISFLVAILLLNPVYNQFRAEQRANPQVDSVDVVYRDLAPDEFISKWMILGALPVFEGKSDPADQETQKKVFEADDPTPTDILKSLKEGKIKYRENNFKWQLVKAGNGVVDFIKIFGDTSFVFAFAYAQVEMPDNKELLMAAGSDDGIKVWVNNQLVHQNWIGRAYRKDDDLFPVKFKKGVNEILIKVQNMQRDWNFGIRQISQTSLTDKLVDCCIDGNLDAVKLVLNYNADLNTFSTSGLTPLQAAQINGRKNIADFLIEKGAKTDLPLSPPEKLVDIFFNSVIKENNPGAAILIAKEGKIIYEKAYGYADVENKIPVNINTKFRIGSITKQFTAAAILKLQEKGLLNVNDPLSKYIPDFPRGNEVKIYNLLTHTSGIHSYTNDPDFIKTVEAEIKPEDLVDQIKKYNYEFNPGDKWEYNNSGYFLLGYIIEKVSGMSYGEFLKQNLFDPAGMKNTGVHSSHIKLENEAVGYSYENNNVTKSINWEMSRAGGAGSIYSTVEDLFHWNEALFNGKILSKESLEAAFTPAEIKDGINTHYGYGWFINENRGLKTISHSGGLQGFNSDLTRFVGENFTEVVLLNCLPTLPGFDASSAGAKIAEFYLWPKMKNLETLEVNKNVSPISYKDYDGQYEYPGGQIMTITAEGDKLFAQLSGQDKFEIFPKNESEFFWKIVDAQITFIRDEKGIVTHAIHHQGGQEFKAPRMEPKTEIKVDPGIYDAYTGEYNMGNGVKCIITKENDRLFGEMTGQPKVELFPQSETEFFLKIVSADVKFVKDETGKVINLVFKQGGYEIKAEKINP
ncbi:MAG TPA: serine hydrolase [Ignavibacteriaceae bacterium]|nr:serine hydrolase [Ignavibacteriaceae bacterium]